MTMTDNEMLGFAASPSFMSDGTFFVCGERGLFKSTDFGASWLPLFDHLAEESRSVPATAVAVSAEFAMDGIVLTAIPGGIGRSSDGGQTWQFTRLSNPQPAITCLALSPGFARDGRAFAGTLQDGVLQTNDGGASWQGWNAGLFDHEVLALAVTPDFLADRTVFAGTGTGLFRSRNAGRSWCAVDLPDTETAVLSIGIQLDGTVFVGTEVAGLWRSADAGQSWRQLSPDRLPTEIRSVLIGPGDRYGVTVFGETGVFRSDDGDTWRRLSDLPTNPRDAFVSALRSGI